MATRRSARISTGGKPPSVEVADILADHFITHETNTFRKKKNISPPVVPSDSEDDLPLTQPDFGSSRGKESATSKSTRGRGGKSSVPRGRKRGVIVSDDEAAVVDGDARTVKRKKSDRDGDDDGHSGVDDGAVEAIDGTANDDVRRGEDKGGEGGGEREKEDVELEGEVASVALGSADPTEQQDVPEDDVRAYTFESVTEVVKGTKVRRVVRLPTIDCCDDEALLDHALVKQGIYKDLPHLAPVYARSWATKNRGEEVDEDGNPILNALDVEAWIANHPTLKRSFLYKAFGFRRSRRYAAPARCDPRDFAAKHWSSKYDRSDGKSVTLESWDVVWGHDMSQALFVSFVAVNQSFVLSARYPSDGGGVIYRCVTGLGQKGDIERTLCFFPMVLDMEGITLQMDGERVITYQSKTKPFNEPRATASPMKGRLITSSYSSPRKKAYNTSAVPSFAPLAWDVPIPVWDARGVKDFDFDDINRSISRCKPFEEEIPFGSFAMVTYTATASRADDGPWRLYFYIRNAVLFSVKEEN
ncbi:hypothetical protein CC1G_07772 [Coprinopsis cinerea okayama7|uniref:Uncharacterized protein n=1 Tax=Coprinopsis cinerea (strain Okayama-7 / 130 / ATCC MYA-4618 / FGSC 9003) TaxID=240176 RepID=A8NNZ3_COPC7|nr:hypothetical protein CC1G_07772 [Coprinopsis cinerea okayama7\|eukprot:XP_001835229.2 hypothetical protein CC1G_07772 [Coprinopsis cinerea okayama7\